MAFWMRTPKPPSSKHTTKKVVLWLIFALVILPTILPARAGVFDPVIKLFTPLYHKIKNNTPTVQENTPDQETTPDNTKTTQEPDEEEPLEQGDVLDEPTISPEEQAAFLESTPDLFVLLQAEFAADRGDPYTALTLYKAESLKQNATAVFERALGLSLQLESPKESLEFAKAWQDSNNDHIPVWFYVTHLALKAGDYGTAVQNLRLILSYDPKVDLSRIFSGIFPTNPEAQRQLFFALQSVDNDTNPSLSVLKSGLLNQMGEPKAALLYAEQAIDSEPDNLAFLTLKADMLTGAKQDKALQEFLTQAQRRTTGETQKQLYLYHIRHLIDQGDLSGAWTLLTEVQPLFKEDGELTLLTSLVALDTNHFAEADTLLSSLLPMPSHKNQAHYYLGISYERQGFPVSAMAHYRQVDDNEFALTATRKLVAYELAQGRPDNAINTLIQLRQRHEMFATESYTLQADILLRQNKPKEALALLNQAAADYPDDPSLLYASTMLMDDATDYQAKLDNITHLLDFEPDNPHYQLEQARLILLRTPNDSATLERVRQISRTIAHPDYDSQLQLQALILLATNALEQGDYQTVIDKLQTPYDVQPDIKVGTLLLRAYQGLGDDVMVQTLVDDLTKRFITTDALNSTPQDY